MHSQVAHAPDGHATTEVVGMASMMASSSRPYQGKLPFITPHGYGKNARSTLQGTLGCPAQGHSQDSCSYLVLQSDCRRACTGQAAHRCCAFHVKLCSSITMHANSFVATQALRIA